MNSCFLHIIRYEDDSDFKKTSQPKSGSETNKDIFSPACKCIRTTLPGFQGL